MEEGGPIRQIREKALDRFSAEPPGDIHTASFRYYSGDRASQAGDREEETAKSMRPLAKMERGLTRSRRGRGVFSANLRGIVAARGR